MSTLLSIILSLVTIAIAIAASWGISVAFKSSAGKQASEIQQQTVNMLQAQITTLKDQLEIDEKELTKLRQLISTIRHALKRRGLHIEIEGDYVTLIDADGNRQSTQPPSVVKVAQPTPSKLSRPVKLQPIPEDDTAS